MPTLHWHSHKTSYTQHVSEIFDNEEPTHMNESILLIYPAQALYVNGFQGQRSFDSIHFGYASNEPCSLSLSPTKYTVLHNDELVHKHVSNALHVPRRTVQPQVHLFRCNAVDLRILSSIDLMIVHS